MRQLKFFQLVFLLVLSTLNSIAQLRLGEATFSYPTAKSLLRSDALATAVRSVRYLSLVGGVAFDKVASPADALHVSDLKLNYNPLANDGKRFSVMINGNEAQANIYDWELVPIAQYANSGNTACFTLFGELEDEERAITIQEKGGQVLNYHPQLANTLLGLRLFQLDILVIQPELSTDLPKIVNNYILGKGEKSPDIYSNKLGFFKYLSTFETKNGDYRSYLICDQNRNIKFGIQNNSLTITGSPFYHFWRYNTDQPSFKKALSNSIENEALQVSKKGVYEFQKNNLLENWLLNKIENEFAILYGVNYDPYYEKFIQQLKAVKIKQGTKKYLGELKQSFYALKIQNTPKEIIYLSDLSTTLSNQPQLFRDINPAVWDAGVKTMRYSAFFRYCKANFPQRWQLFMNQISSVKVKPSIVTPTVMTINRYKAIK